jgi:hypothetical protein
VLSQTASDVLLDASVLCRFAQFGLLKALRGYLGNRARITREVERELLRLSARSEFRQLRDYLAKDGIVARGEGKWPKRTNNLPNALKPQFSTLLELKRALEGREHAGHDRAHAGEIATVLMAKHRHSDLIIMDDDWGHDLGAKTYRLAVMSTARLTLEMVVADALTEEEGLAVFVSATPVEVGRDRYYQALRQIRG